MYLDIRQEWSWTSGCSRCQSRLCYKREEAADRKRRRSRAQEADERKRRTGNRGEEAKERKRRTEGGGGEKRREELGRRKSCNLHTEAGN